MKKTGRYSKDNRTKPWATARELPPGKRIKSGRDQFGINLGSGLANRRHQI